MVVSGAGEGSALPVSCSIAATIPCRMSLGRLWSRASCKLRTIAALSGVMLLVSSVDNNWLDTLLYGRGLQGLGGGGEHMRPAGCDTLGYVGVLAGRPHNSRLTH